MVKCEFLKKIAVFGWAFLMAANTMVPVKADFEEKKFNMSYIYFGNNSSYEGYVDRTKGSLDEISPNYFNLDNNGDLELTTAIDTDFISNMHDKGVKVVPFLSNHWDREKGKAALQNGEALAEQIAKAVKTYKLDGVNVDIENMTEAEREEYVGFVKILNKKLPADKIIAVAVAPNPFRSDKGWQGSYDYAALAKYSDYLMIMAYDEHYQGGPAGPVASYNFVENSIKYALERAPKEKLVLGLPFYGRLWKNGAAYGGYGISAVDVEKLVAEYNGKVTIDSVTKSPKAVITIKQGDKKPKVFGSTLTAGTYTIWYENEQSIKYKLTLVQKYDLKGTGSWSLGQESPNTWDYYDLWLNGCYFADVAGHWAQDAILSVQKSGLMVGASDSMFLPENSLSRAQAAVILVRALGLEDETGRISFNDVENHWAKKEIEIAVEYGIVKGISDGTFSPDSPVTRAQMAVMLGRVLQFTGASLPGKGYYQDVKQEGLSWAYDSIVQMSRYGIFSGYPDGKFHPWERINRAQMATLMDKISTRVDNGEVNYSFNLSHALFLKF